MERIHWGVVVKASSSGTGAGPTPYLEGVVRVDDGAGNKIGFRVSGAGTCPDGTGYANVSLSGTSYGWSFLDGLFYGEVLEVSRCKQA